MQLKNKTAIVTGSGQGIGLGIALALAKEGCNIVITDINPDTCKNAVEEVKTLGVEAIAVTCNVANGTEVYKLVESTIEHFGKVDILVNNAGVYPFVPFKNMKEADWDKVMSINLKGTFFCSQAASAVMKPGSKIINISSIASMIGYVGLVHYCASKGGINGFTRALALELAPQKINVNAVAPGAIETPGAKMAEDQKKGTIGLIPWKRIGTPEDIGNAVVFLASESSDYITGQVLPVDGGWTIY